MLRLEHELPALPTSVQWLDRPPLPVPHGLRDHVVALLFWRLGCVHSQLALAELARLAERFAGRPFVALAMHVPTCDAEASVARVRRAVAALPVTLALDSERAAVRQLGIARLPALVLLDVRGIVRAHGIGEPDVTRLAAAIAALLQEQAAAGAEPAAPLIPLQAPPRRLEPRALCAMGQTVWLAAAGHRRIYSLTLQGVVRRTIGSGHAGRTDGPGHVAAFLSPTGLASLATQLVVADVGSHSLRAVDAHGQVATWCGTGERSDDRHGGGFGVDQGLGAPRAVLAEAGGLYVAVAGTHQLWQVDPATGSASAWLGRGQRGLVDGHEDAAFAEPSGLALHAGSLFVADTGNGAVRSVDLAHISVRTLATGLLRPVSLAIAAREPGAGELFVADAWRPAVLRMPTDGGALQPWLGAEHGLLEPVALAVVGDNLWIADVGADAVFVAALQGPPALQRLDLTGMPSLPDDDRGLARARVCAPVQLLEFSDVTLRIPLPIADDEMLDSSLPCSVRLHDEGSGLLACDVNHAVTPAAEHCEVLVPMAERGSGALRIRIELSTRERTSGIPQARCYDFVVPVAVTATGQLRADLVVCDLTPSA